MDEERITLVDEQTGEQTELLKIDEFDFEDRSYSVFVTLNENEDEEMVLIMEKIIEGDEISYRSLDESEEDAVYDHYDTLFEDYDDDEEA